MAITDLEEFVKGLKVGGEVRP